MESRKETIKSVVLVLLVVLSVFLTFVITTYQPDYEIFTKRTSKKTTVNRQEEVDNLLNFLTPNVIVKTNADSREEPVVQNTITKVSTVDAIKDKKIQKEILRRISSSESEEARIRNKNIEEVTMSTGEKIVLEYNVVLDTALVKQIFFSQENTNISLDFDRVVLLKDKPNTIYLYKKDAQNYLQVNLKNNIYDSINEEFDKEKQTYRKYSLNNNFIYLKDSEPTYYIDEYSTEDINLNKLGRDIFEANGGIKTTGENEVSDGYALLRNVGNRILYINPSNEEKNSATAIQSLGFAVNFVVLGYGENQNYQLIYSRENFTQFQEVYKDSLVFNKEKLSSIKVQSNTAGVYQVTSPKKMAKTYLSSSQSEAYNVEDTEYVLNYLYGNVDLKKITDVVLGYEKTYSNTRNVYEYRPTWYVKYNDEYKSFKELKDLIQKGA